MEKKSRKASYVSSKLTVILLAKDDVITTSGTLDFEGNGGEGNMAGDGWTPPEW